MIKHIMPSSGANAHWLVTNSRITSVYLQESKNRTGLKLSTRNKAGKGGDQRNFGIGDPVVILLPPGTWQSKRDSDSDSRIIESKAPNLWRINVFLTGTKPFPATRTRWTKIKDSEYSDNEKFGQG